MRWQWLCIRDFPEKAYKSIKLVRISDDDEDSDGVCLFVGLLRHFRDVDRENQRKRGNNKMSRPITVLLIDDSSFARQMVAKILTSQGNEVLEAMNGQEGIEKAEQHRPDCIVLDLLMPEMDGFGVLRALKEKDLLIPTIVLSADIQETAQAECLKLGAVAFLKKPFKEDELLETLHGIFCSK